MVRILPVLLLFASGTLIAQEKLLYHAIRTDKSGNIIPWYSDHPGESYNHVMHLLWNFWDTMRVDLNGIPYYLNHQVWRADFNDPRGLGGDQIQMAMSSWSVYYAYTGNEKVKENMKFLADFYLTRGLSSPQDKWPSIPYPYNTLVYSGVYDGDMVIGKGFTQPDKAGSFGKELVRLFKMMSNERYPHATEKRYLEAAIAIANTLASHVQAGDENASPMPFKVNAITGEVGKLKSNSGDRTDAGLSNYTTNWSGTVELFLELAQLNSGNVDQYRKAADVLVAWMKKYPMKNNKWGPFFEDIPGWSDTQINAMTWARFIMNHREMFPQWKTDVQSIISWVYKTLGNEEWKKYGLTVVNEQTAYQTPGNSHTARQAADELLFASLTNDWSRKDHAIRQLNWATYMVDIDGKNRYPRDENWLTDGYGDYIRHYLRAMQALPELAPPRENHMLHSTSVIQHVGYGSGINKFIVPVVSTDAEKAIVYYSAFDNSGEEILHLMSRPSRVLVNDKPLSETKEASTAGFEWKPLQAGGGTLIVRRLNGRRVVVYE